MTPPAASRSATEHIAMPHSIRWAAHLVKPRGICRPILRLSAPPSGYLHSRLSCRMSHGGRRPSGLGNLHPPQGAAWRRAWPEWTAGFLPWSVPPPSEANIAPSGCARECGCRFLRFITGSCGASVWTARQAMARSAGADGRPAIGRCGAGITGAAGRPIGIYNGS